MKRILSTTIILAICIALCACSAKWTDEDTADFISKMQIALKEANETGYWLELLYKTNYIGEEQYNFLESKCKSLRAMLVSSINTAKNNIK